MWNDKVEASPKERKDWIVPIVFVTLAFIGLGAFALGLYG